MFRENGLGVKLHAFNIKLAVTQPHDRLLGAAVVLGPGSDPEAIRQRVCVDHETVITGSSEWAGQIFEHAFTRMINGAGFAVHHFLRADNLTPKNGANALLSQTNTKYRHFAGEVLDHRHGNTRFLG